MPCFPVGELKARNRQDSIRLRDQVREIIWGGPEPLLPSLEISDGSSLGVSGAGIYNVYPTNGPGSLIAIQYSDPEIGVATGETVTIYGVAGTTEVNGDFTVTGTPTPTTAILGGTTFVNAYTGGGAILHRQGPASLLGRVPALAQWHRWSWGFGGLPEMEGIVSRSFYVQWPGATKLMIYCVGHQLGYFAPPGGKGPPTPALTAYLQRLSALGIDLMLHSVPWWGENIGLQILADPTYNYPTFIYDAHTLLGTRDIHQPPQGHRIRYFVDPIVASINYATGLRNYDRIGMSGMSGGAWTTTMMAAIEPRITHSYAVSGSVPLAHRAPGEIEWEQTVAPVELGVDYHDLYLMAVAEPDRKAMLLHHFNDGVFNLAQISGYAWRLREIAEGGGYGKLRFMVDPSATVHDVNQADADTIIADFLS